MEAVYEEKGKDWGNGMKYAINKTINQIFEEFMAVPEEELGIAIERQKLRDVTYLLENSIFFKPRR